MYQSNRAPAAGAAGGVMPASRCISSRPCQRQKSSTSCTAAEPKASAVDTMSAAAVSRKTAAFCPNSTKRSSTRRQAQVKPARRKPLTRRRARKPTSRQSVPISGSSTSRFQKFSVTPVTARPPAIKPIARQKGESLTSAISCAGVRASDDSSCAEASAGGSGGGVCGKSGKTWSVMRIPP